MIELLKDVCLAQLYLNDDRGCDSDPSTTKTYFTRRCRLPVQFLTFTVSLLVVCLCIYVPESPTFMSNDSLCCDHLRVNRKALNNNLIFDS